MRTSYRLILAVSVLFTLLLSAQARGQDFVTYGDSFNIPVFESIDQNGVDLINGVMRASTPILESGSEQKKLRVGLTWTGKSWAHIGQPTIWRKDSVYTVSYDGVTEEFKIASGQLVQKSPLQAQNWLALDGGLRSL